METININIKYTLSKPKLKIINILIKHIMNTNLKNNYNFSFKSQKYTLKYILIKIFYMLYESHKWRNLGSDWNNIYKHFIRLNKLNIFKNTFNDMLNKYLKKHKNGLKYVMCDSSIIYNKYGINNKSRNPFYKNKNSNKIFTIVNDKYKPLFFDIVKGTVNDAKILNTYLDSFLDNNKNIKYLLADSGFCSKKIKNKLIKYNVKPLIAKNFRNNNKYKNINKKDKFKYMLDELNCSEKIIYNKRIKVVRLL